MKKNLHFAAIFTLSLIISQTSTSAFSQTRAQMERCHNYTKRAGRMINSAQNRYESGDFCRDMCLNVKYRDDITILNKKAALCYESIGDYEISNLIYEGINEPSMGSQALDYRVYKRCGCKMVSD